MDEETTGGEGEGTQEGDQTLEDTETEESSEALDAGDVEPSEAPEGEEEELEASDEEEEEVDAEEDEDKEDAKAKKQKPEKGARFNRRIQGLISERRELRSGLSQLQEQLQTQSQQAQHYLRQYEQKLHESQLKMAEMGKELEYLRQGRVQAEEAELSPVEKFQRTLQRKLETEFNSKLEAAIAERDKKWDEFQAEQKALKSQAESKERITRYKTEAANAVSELLADVPDDYKAAINEPLLYHIFNYATAWNKNLADAAKDFDRLARRYVAGKMKASTTKNQKTVKQAQKITRPAKEGSRPTKSGNPLAGFQDAQKQGFRGDPLDFISAQRNRARRGA